MKNKEQCPFKLGDAVVWTPHNFNSEFWKNLSEEDRAKYYGPLGYGADSPVVFVFITEINQASGHCILVSLKDQSVETFRHTEEFRLATDDEI